MELLNIFLIITFSLTGLFTGSFLNVCIYRIPRGNFFESNRSYCPNCHTTLNWYELVPIFSYIFLKGRCRTCKEQISARYPLVESANMILWLLAYLRFGLTFYTILVVVLFSILIVMSMIDIDIKEIPNGIILAIIALGLLTFISSDAFLSRDNFLDVLFDKGIGFLIMSVPFLIIGIITGGIGGGDIKLLAAMGLFLGIKLIVLGGLLGVVIGGLVAVALLIFKRAGRKTEMPLGPSLALGFVIATLYGVNIIDWYTALF
ncbi:MAG: prepilin peptidase [Christensenellales bacterium]|jgi:leader peptidase (prepilin peptidase)/N-methyltransferase